MITKSVTGLALSCALAIGGIATVTPSQASAQERSQPGNTALVAAVSTATNSQGSILDSPNSAVELLKVIDEIPESVLLQGDEATRTWVENKMNSGTTPGRVKPMRNWLKCSGAILAVVGTTALPAAKLLKIKRYMNALGGTWEAIRLLWGASFAAEKLTALGGAAAALGAELLGITAIKEACL